MSFIYKKVEYLIWKHFFLLLGMYLVSVLIPGDYFWMWRWQSVVAFIFIHFITLWELWESVFPQSSKCRSLERGEHTCLWPRWNSNNDEKKWEVFINLMVFHREWISICFIILVLFATKWHCWIFKIWKFAFETGKV